METFSPKFATQEAIAYADFFKQWVDKGYRLDLVINWHNLESAEGPHWMCPVMDPDPIRREPTLLFLQTVRGRLNSDGFLTGKGLPPPDTLPTRLGGWLSKTYGALDVSSVVNSQEARSHLSMPDLQRIGSDVLISGVEYLTSSEGAKWRTAVDAFRQERDNQWSQRKGSSITNNALADEETVRSHSDNTPTSQAP